MLALLHPPTGDNDNPENQSPSDPDSPFLWGRFCLALGLGILGFVIVFQVIVMRDSLCLPPRSKQWVEHSICAISPLS